MTESTGGWEKNIVVRVKFKKKMDYIKVISIQITYKIAFFVKDTKQ